MVEQLDIRIADETTEVLHEFKETELAEGQSMTDYAIGAGILAIGRI